MKRLFLSNLVFVLFANVLVKPIWIFGIDRTVQNLVGPTAYGSYFVLLNISFLGGFLLDFGLTQFNNRYIAQNHKILEKQFGFILSLKLVLGLFYATIMGVLPFFLGYDVEVIKLFYWLLFNQFLLSIATFIRSNLNALHRFRADSILSISDKLIMIILCGGLFLSQFWRDKFDIYTFVHAQTFAYLITCFIAFFVLRPHLKSFIPKWDTTYFKALLKQGMPFALLSLLIMFYTRIDMLLLPFLLPENGNQQAGYYAAAYRLLEAANMFPILVSTLLMPIFTRAIKQHVDIFKLFKFSCLILITPAFVFWTISLINSADLLAFLYIDLSSQSASIFQNLMAAFLFYSLNYLLGTLLTAAGELRFLNKLSIITLLVAMLSNYIFVPSLGGLGISRALLITQLVLFLGHWFKIRNFFRFPNFDKMSLLVLFNLIFDAFIMLKISTLDIGWKYKTSLAVVLIGLNAGLWLYFGFKDLRQYLKRIKTFL